MIDLSWVELLFCAVLALIVIGPRDMPPLFRAAGRLVQRGRRLYNTMLGSVRQLENEIDIASGQGRDDQAWQALIPEEVRNLPDDFMPGSQSAQVHRERAERTRAAREQWQREQACETSEKSEDSTP